MMLLVFNKNLRSEMEGDMFIVDPIGAGRMSSRELRASLGVGGSWMRARIEAVQWKGEG